jgi:adenine specific DNA methylase Mod
MNKLFFGDNLDMLQRHIKDESVDLVYLDPPFNSNANYNVLFRERGDVPSEAQAEAFRDTWSWGPSAAIAYDQLIRGGGPVVPVIISLREWLGDTGMMAYLAMMGVRLVELHRVLKDTGSLYLHCDSTASHYLKILLDAVFGKENYRNEIIWRRYRRPKGSQFEARKFGKSTDTILFYSKTDNYKFFLDRVKMQLSGSELKTRYPNEDEHGLWCSGPLLRSQGMGARPNLVYKYDGYTPGPAGWRMKKGKLEALDKAGDLYWTSSGIPRRKVRPGIEPGAIIDNLWFDIEAIGSQAAERLGYPTQKPLSLLERIIKVSSDKGDVVLDPFCGCGTTVEAAESLEREWVGIDVTHYAVTLIERRLQAYKGANFKVVGRPTDLAGAQDLARRDKYQFQWWASWLLGAQTYETKKGADRGIDGNIYFLNGPYGHGRIIVSVKGGDQLSPVMVRELAGTVEREGAEMGILVTLGEPTKAMLTEASGHGFVSKSAHGRLPRIQITTAQDLLDRRLPKMPPIPKPADQEPRRKSAKDRDQLELLFAFEGDGIRTGAGGFVDPAWLLPNRRSK